MGITPSRRNPLFIEVHPDLEEFRSSMMPATTQNRETIDLLIALVNYRLAGAGHQARLIVGAGAGRVTVADRYKLAIDTTELRISDARTGAEEHVPWIRANAVDELGLIDLADEVADTLDAHFSVVGL